MTLNNTHLLMFWKILQIIQLNWFFFNSHTFNDYHKIIHQPKIKLCHENPTQTHTNKIGGELISDRAVSDANN